MAIIISSGVVLALVSGVISFFIPRQYSAESQVLIMPRDVFGSDQLTQIKSAERVGENLAEIVHTTDFYKKVMDNSESAFDKQNWVNLLERQRRKKWAKDVQAGMIYGTSLMRVVAYSGNQGDALAMCRAVTQVLATRAFEYVGGNITVKVVSDPLVSRWPARPNFVLNITLGLLFGLALGALYSLIKYKKHHLLFG